MTPELWRQVESIFEDAHQLPADERQTFLDRICPDPIVRHEVESLLRHTSSEGGDLGKLVDDIAQQIPHAQEPPRPLDDLVGREIGHYRIRRLIGEGGMGRVYVAEDVRLGREVALKLLPFQDAEKNDRASRFQLEARAASALNHPNIVTVHDFGHAEGLYYIATELVQGCTLREVITERRLADREIVDLAMQIAGALAEAHAAGIVHRDIKPENLMLRPDGYVKVLDFGLAKLRDRQNARTSQNSLTQPGMVMGTARYMSPEQARGDDTDARSDLFSLGIVIYEVVLGRHPFPGRTGADVLAAILEQEPSPIAHDGAMAGEWEAILRKCLRKDRNLRYQTSNDLLADLRQFKQSLESSSGAKPRVALGKVRKRLKPIPIVLGILAVCSIAAVGIVHPWRPAEQQWFKNIRLSTVSGVTSVGTISPSGRYIVYSPVLENDRRSLNLRLVTGGGEIELAPPAKLVYYHWAFSADESYVYYFTQRPGSAEKETLFRVSIFGGPRLKILEGAEAWTLAVSPDGTKLVFTRSSSQGTQLVIAEADGSGERTLTTSARATPFQSAQWSADGKEILFAEGIRDQAGVSWQILGVSPSGGSPKVRAKVGRNGLNGWASLPDGGYLINILDRDTNLPQIWHLGRAGELQRVTHDLSEYQGVTVTRDGRTVVTTAASRRSEIWTVDMKGEDAPKPISDSRQRFDQPLWTHDGDIVAMLYTAGHWNLVAMKADGTGRHELGEPGSVMNLEQSACPDRGEIVFASKRNGTINIWRANLATNDFKQLTFGPNDRYPQCIAGGSVIYRSSIGDKVTTSSVGIDGGTLTNVTGLSYDQLASPDGKLVMVNTIDKTTQAQRTAVRKLDGSTLMTFPYQSQLEAWAPDSRGVAFVSLASGFAEIWYQPLPKGQPRRVTNFGKDFFYSLAWSPDGRHVVCARGRIASDLVFIQDVR